MKYSVRGIVCSSYPAPLHIYPFDYKEKPHPNLRFQRQLAVSKITKGGPSQGNRLVRFFMEPL